MKKKAGMFVVTGLIIAPITCTYVCIVLVCRPHISDHGSCDVSVSSVSLNVKVTVGADSKGRPTISANGCSISIGHLDITFHGGARYKVLGASLMKAIDNPPAGCTTCLQAILLTT